MPGHLSEVLEATVEGDVEELVAKAATVHMKQTNETRKKGEKKHFKNITTNELKMRDKK